MTTPHALGRTIARSSRAIPLHKFSGVVFLFFAGSILALVAFASPGTATWIALGIPTGLAVGWFVGAADAEETKDDLIRRGASNANHKRLKRDCVLVVPFLGIGTFLSVAWLTGQVQPAIGLALGGATFIHTAVAVSVHSFLLQQTLRFVELESGQRVWAVRDGLWLSYAIR